MVVADFILTTLVDKPCSSCPMIGLHDVAFVISHSQYTCCMISRLQRHWRTVWRKSKFSRGRCHNYARPEAADETLQSRSNPRTSKPPDHEGD